MDDQKEEIPVENYVAQHYIENPYLIGGEMPVYEYAPCPSPERSVSHLALTSSLLWAWPDTRHDGIERRRSVLPSPTCQSLPRQFLCLAGPSHPLLGSLKFPSFFKNQLGHVVYPTKTSKEPIQCQLLSWELAAHPALTELVPQTSSHKPETNKQDGSAQ